jgi:hypothetical protein
MRKEQAHEIDNERRHTTCEALTLRRLHTHLVAKILFHSVILIQIYHVSFGLDVAPVEQNLHLVPLGCFLGYVVWRFSGAAQGEQSIANSRGNVVVI